MLFAVCVYIQSSETFALDSSDILLRITYMYENTRIVDVPLVENKMRMYLLSSESVYV